MNSSLTQRIPRSLTLENIEESRLLKIIWNRTGHKGLTQEAFGQHYDIGGQAAVGFFLNGRCAISLKAAKGFALGLGCKISEFSPRLAMEANEVSLVSDMPAFVSAHVDDISKSAADQRSPSRSQAIANLSPAALELALLFDELTDRIERAVALHGATEQILRVLQKIDLPASGVPNAHGQQQTLLEDGHEPPLFSRTRSKANTAQADT